MSFLDQEESIDDTKEAPNKAPTPKERLTDGDDEKTQIHEGKFAGRKGDFIKYKDEYFDIKKDKVQPKYVKFKHTVCFKSVGW